MFFEAFSRFFEVFSRRFQRCPRAAFRVPPEAFSGFGRGGFEAFWRCFSSLFEAFSTFSTPFQGFFSRRFKVFSWCSSRRL